MIVGNTFDEAKFGAMISKAIKDRESFIIKKHSLEIETDSIIASALKSTSMVSCKLIYLLNITSKGRSHLLLREPNPDHNPKKLRHMLSTERKDTRKQRMK